MRETRFVTLDEFAKQFGQYRQLSDMELVRLETIELAPAKLCLTLRSGSSDRWAVSDRRTSSCENASRSFNAASAND